MMKWGFSRKSFRQAEHYIRHQAEQGSTIAVPELRSKSYTRAPRVTFREFELEIAIAALIFAIRVSAHI